MCYLRLNLDDLVLLSLYDVLQFCYQKLFYEVSTLKALYILTLQMTLAFENCKIFF